MPGSHGFQTPGQPGGFNLRHPENTESPESPSIKSSNPPQEQGGALSGLGVAGAPRGPVKITRRRGDQRWERKRRQRGCWYAAAGRSATGRCWQGPGPDQARGDNPWGSPGRGHAGGRLRPEEGDTLPEIPGSLASQRPAQPGRGIPAQPADAGPGKAEPGSGLRRRDGDPGHGENIRGSGLYRQGRRRGGANPQDRSPAAAK